MSDRHHYRIKGGERVHLDALPTSCHGGMDKAEGVLAFQRLQVELKELQELLYGAASHSVLLIFQGRDTSGKDGVINSILTNINAMGCQTTAFKAPTADELARDFLWRVHNRVPPRGMLGLFNRSHYEDVLVTRVHSLVPEAVWKQRYRHINHFEQLLVDSGTIVLKFFLHISAQEQEERLLAREQDSEKSWKLAVSDWEDRAHWDEYTRAYEDVFEKCSASAPWHVIPADRKWFRNFAVSEIVVRALEPYRDDWKKILEKRGQRALSELSAWKQKQTSERG